MSDKSQQSRQALAAFLDLDARGLRGKAKVAVQNLIKSLPAPEDKDRWTRDHLDQLPTNGAGRIRHEIFQEIVFPVLATRYESNDPEASYLLGKTYQNFISSPEFYRQIGFQHATEFFERAYVARPENTRYRLAYLQALTRCLDDQFHEWPAGILIDHENWQESLAAVKMDITMAALLDEEGRYTARFETLTAQSDAYHKRLSQRQ